MTQDDFIVPGPREKKRALLMLGIGFLVGAFGLYYFLTEFFRVEAIAGLEPAQACHELVRLVHLFVLVITLGNVIFAFYFFRTGVRVNHEGVYPLDHSASMSRIRRVRGAEAKLRGKVFIIIAAVLICLDVGVYFFSQQMEEKHLRCQAYTKLSEAQGYDDLQGGFR